MASLTAVIGPTPCRVLEANTIPQFRREYCFTNCKEPPGRYWLGKEREGHRSRWKMSLGLTTLTKKREVDSIIRDTIDKVLVLRFGRASDPLSLQLDDIISKSAREVSKFATVALVDTDSEEIQVYVKSADHTKWVGAFQRKQDFIDVVEAIYRGAMKGKLIVSCPLPPERIPKFQLLYNDV